MNLNASKKRTAKIMLYWYLIFIKLLSNRIMLVPVLLCQKKTENGYYPLVQGYSPIRMPTDEFVYHKVRDPIRSMSSPFARFDSIDRTAKFDDVLHP